MTLEINASYGAPFVAKMTKASPTLAVSNLMKRYRRASVEKIAKLYMAECRDDPDLADANALWVAVLAHQNILRRAKEAEAATPEAAAITREMRAAESVKLAQKVEVAVKETRRVWFAQIMQCTFGEVARMAKAAPRLAKLAKMGKPNQRVADVLSEKSVAKVLG